MNAVQLVDVAKVAITDVPVPSIKPGEALLRVLAAGVCSTDTQIRSSTESMIPTGTILGHEIVGEIVEVADPASHVSLGDQVVVHPVWSCRTCRPCRDGRQNACRGTSGRLAQTTTPGISADGGMAEYVAVPASALVAANGVDPALAAVLPDAGLVPFHSVQATADLLHPGAIVVLIGIGGLGQFAVDLLGRLTGVRIVALDVNDQALAIVEDRVDQVLRADKVDVERRLLGFVGPHGADVVIDFVGNDRTLGLSASIVSRYGAIRVPGLGHGVFPFETAHTSTSLPWGASITRPYSGTHVELEDLVSLAREHEFLVRLKRYAFADALEAFDDLDNRRVHGRAVIMP